MNEKDIRKYAQLMKELGLTGLEISEDDKKIRLERNPAPAVPESPGNLTAGAEADSAVSPTNTAAGDCIRITSPIVGVFYAAPAENAEPFVKPGDRVEQGQTLCIIEAMKLMNEIAAEESGIIEQVCVTNGQVVEFGTELFRIRR